jgi:hypothetical protein
MACLVRRPHTSAKYAAAENFKSTRTSKWLSLTQSRTDVKKLEDFGGRRVDIAVKWLMQAKKYGLAAHVDAKGSGPRPSVWGDTATVCMCICMYVCVCMLYTCVCVCVYV